MSKQIRGYNASEIFLCIWEQQMQYFDTQYTYYSKLSFQLDSDIMNSLRSDNDLR